MIMRCTVTLRWSGRTRLCRRTRPIPDRLKGASHPQSSDSPSVRPYCSSFDGLVSILDDEKLLKDIPLEDVRNFCFIAHVDHGKSSLSSRILELTGTLGRQQQRTAWEAVAAPPSSIPHSEGGDEDEKFKKTSSLSSASSSFSGKERIELLDSLSVEQQRGITVKATTATMLYRHPSAVGPGGVLLLNLYDTPGMCSS